MPLVHVAVHGAACEEAAPPAASSLVASRRDIVPRGRGEAIAF